MTPEELQDRHARAAGLVRELGALARELVRLDLMADRASARGDADALCDVAELMIDAHVKWAERYRTLLVVRIREPGTAPGNAAVLPLRAERSSL